MAETANIMLPGAPNQPIPGVTGTGAIKGGLLRPGSIDQSQFQQLLQAQQQANEAATVQPGLTLDDYRKLAGAPRQIAAATPAPENAAPPPLAPSDGIPTLSAEQFAVLTGMSNVEDPVAAPEMPAAATGAPLEMVPAQLAAASDPALDDPDAYATDPALTDPALESDGVPVLDPVEATAPHDDAAEESGNPRIVWVNTPPDRDERRGLAAAGKIWRLRETPGANELFLGPDGKFGWDDFIDIINPLQHIPVVAQIYRAVTGDQAYALSQFAGAIPFGPLSAASAVIDTVVRAQTGRDAGTDIAAAVLGIDNRTPEEANLHLVVPPDSGNLAAGDAAGDLVGAGAGAPLQTAALPPMDIWSRNTSSGRAN
jgi:hypothetical protein